MKLALILSALCLCSVGFAKERAPLNMTIKCQVINEYEQGSNESNPEISFDANKGYKSLEIGPIYGLQVRTFVTQGLEVDSDKSTYAVQSICVHAKGADVCSGSASMTLYPNDRYAQPGDRTEINCKLIM